jgi:hypothetical protein
MGGRSGQSVGTGGSNISSLAVKSAKDAEKIHKGDVDGYERSVYRDIDGLNQRNNNLKSTEELKNEVGRYISTERIHGKDNVSMPQDVKYHIQDLGKTKVDGLINKNANKTIKVSDINIVQQYVFEKPLKKAIATKNYKVVVYEYKGKYYLNDGNHRVAAAKLNNVKNIKAVIEKVD